VTHYRLFANRAVSKVAKSKTGGVDLCPLALQTDTARYLLGEYPTKSEKVGEGGVSPRNHTALQHFGPN